MENHVLIKSIHIEPPKSLPLNTANSKQGSYSKIYIEIHKNFREIIEKWRLKIPISGHFSDKNSVKFGQNFHRTEPNRIAEKTPNHRTEPNIRSLPVWNPLRLNCLLDHTIQNLSLSNQHCSHASEKLHFRNACILSSYTMSNICLGAVACHYLPTFWCYEHHFTFEFRSLLFLFSLYLFPSPFSTSTLD